MTLTLTLTKTLPGLTGVPMPSLVLIGPAVQPAISNRQTDKHITFYYVDLDNRVDVLSKSVFNSVFKK